MKREELKAKGIADEHIDSILDAWHNGHKSLLDQVQALTKERDEARAETKKYQKGGEFYVDKDEIERLQNFEKDTLTKEVKANKTAWLTKLFKDANASDTGTKLLVKSINLDKIEEDGKGSFKGGADIVKQAKADYADIFTSGETGVPQSHETGSAPASTRKKFY